LESLSLAILFSPQACIKLTFGGPPPTVLRLLQAPPCLSVPDFFFVPPPSPWFFFPQFSIPPSVARTIVAMVGSIPVLGLSFVPFSSFSNTSFLVFFPGSPSFGQSVYYSTLKFERVLIPLDFFFLFFLMSKFPFSFPLCLCL